jgi:hypothetical protein
MALLDAMQAGGNVIQLAPGSVTHGALPRGDISR